MTNLYFFQSKNCLVHCFANSESEASQVVIANSPHYNKLYSYTISLVDDESILNEDGVSFLREHDFVGIPQIKHFMLNGSQFHIEEYFAKNNSARFWWSEKVPGSENIRAKQTV